MLFLVPGVSYGASILDLDLSEAELVLYIEELQKQVVLLQEELARRQGAFEEVEEEVDPDVREALDTTFDYDFTAIYRVADDAELVRVDRSRINSFHKDIWELFVDIAGEGFVERYVDQLLIYDEPKGGTAAFVESIGGPSSWTLGVEISDVNLQTERGQYELVQTFVHEYGHLLTLNRTQVDPKVRAHDCGTYFVGIGCLKSGSYFAEFVLKFWDADDLRHAREVAREDDIDDILDLAEEYFEDNETDFITEYAATSPGEDIAESFMFFVLEDSPRHSRTEKNQKILFFYEYPELLLIRDNILEEIQDIL